MSNVRKVVAVAVLAALAWAVAPVAEAQPPIRIGVSASQTGVRPALRQAHERKRRGGHAVLGGARGNRAESVVRVEYSPEVCDHLNSRKEVDE